jgi:hypothetical protein
MHSYIFRYKHLSVAIKTISVPSKKSYILEIYLSYLVNYCTALSPCYLHFFFKFQFYKTETEDLIVDGYYNHG